MATFNSKKIVDQIIAGNGRIDQDDAPDNPRATRIVEYTTQSGKRAWGVTFPGESIDRYLEETEFVRDPVIIWEDRSSYFVQPDEGIVIIKKKGGGDTTQSE